LTVTDLSPAVATAIAELEREYAEVSANPDGTGGAFLTIKSLDLGPKWSPRVVDLSFQVAFNYPFAAIYPFYTAPPLTRTDGGPSPAALQRVGWRGADVTQISLRANRWNPNVDTAVGAVAQVGHWFRELA
jgi:hypothetical protein